MLRYTDSTWYRDRDIISQGEAIREICRLLGVSQQGLARRIGVCPQTVRRWISGSVVMRKPSAMLLESMVSRARSRS